jgi:hypothetical protein
MSVKMRQKPLLSLFRRSEVDCKHTTAWFQNPPHFPGAFLTGFAGKMVKHQCAQRHVEMCVGKRQRLRGRHLERNFNACLSRLPLGSDKHLRRCVYRMYRARRPHLSLGLDCKASRAATYV